MLLIPLHARMGESLGQLQLALPFNSFELLLTKLNESLPAPAVPTVNPAVKWTRNFDSIPIELRALWPSFKVPARELFNLKVGEVLPLQPVAAEKIELRVGTLTKFRGRLGTREENWAVQITEIAKL